MKMIVRASFIAALAVSACCFTGCEKKSAAEQAKDDAASMAADAQKAAGNAAKDAQKAASGAMDSLKKALK